jgi:hypothetical protein
MIPDIKNLWKIISSKNIKIGGTDHLMRRQVDVDGPSL